MSWGFEAWGEGREANLLLVLNRSAMTQFLSSWYSLYLGMMCRCIFHSSPAIPTLVRIFSIVPESWNSFAMCGT